MNLTNVQLGSPTAPGAPFTTNRFIDAKTFKLVINGTGTNIFELTTGAAGATRRFAWASTGQYTMDAYGAGTFTGTATKWLAVTAAGLVIEEAPPSGGSTMRFGFSGEDDTAAEIRSFDLAGNTISIIGGNFGLGITPTSKLHLLTTAIGVTQSDANGILLINTTAAAAGAQQMSPPLIFAGQGWKTNATAATIDVRWKMDVLPVQGAANPSSLLRFASSVNAGAYTNRVSLGPVGATAATIDATTGETGMTINYTTGVGLNISGGTGLSIQGLSNGTAEAARFVNFGSANSTVVPVMKLEKQAGGALGANGIGLTVDHYIEIDSGALPNVGRYQTVVTDVTAGAYYAEHRIILAKNGSLVQAISLKGDGTLTLTGRNLNKQGADVASVAGAIAVGFDGNTFELTGTNAVTLLSNVGWQNGAEVTFLFTSTASLTDGTANSGTDIGFELNGNANFTGSADDAITLVLSEIGGTQRWREKCRSVN